MTHYGIRGTAPRALLQVGRRRHHKREALLQGCLHRRGVTVTLSPELNSLGAITAARPSFCAPERTVLSSQLGSRDCCWL